MSQEQSPSEMELSESIVIEAIQQKGIENPEVIKLIGDWTIAEQNRSGGTPVDSIMVEVSRAELFIKAGAVEEAKSDLESALERVSQEKYANTPFKEKCAELEKEILKKFEGLE